MTRLITVFFFLTALLAGETVYFGENTVAGAGGWQPLDGSDQPITLTGIVSSSGMGSHTPSIDGNGRLVFDIAGAPDGGTVTVEDAGSNEYVAEISELADTWSVATWIEAHAAVNNVPSATGGTVLFRPWDFNTSTGDGAEIRDKVTFANEGLGLTLAGEGDHLTTITPRLIMRQMSNVRLINIDFYTAGESNPAIQLTGPNNQIVIDDCWVHGAYRDPLADYSDGSYSNTDTLIKSVESGAGWTRGVAIRNCKVYDTMTAIQINAGAAGSGIFIEDNEVYNIYADAIKWQAYDAGVNGDIRIERNRIHGFVGNPSDTGNPHVDCIQLVSEYSSAIENVIIRDNVMWQDPSTRGKGIQGITSFEDGSNRAILSGALVTGNLIAIDGPHHITGQYQNSIISFNTIVNPDPGGVEGLGYSDGQERINLEGTTSGSPSLGGNTVLNNITERAMSPDSQTGNTLTGNLVLGDDGATYAYTTIFTGPDWSNETYEATIAAWSVDTGEAGAGKGFEFEPSQSPLRIHRGRSGGALMTILP